MTQVIGLGGQDIKVVPTTVTAVVRTREEKLGMSSRNTDDVRKNQTKFLEIKKKRLQFR